MVSVMRRANVRDTDSYSNFILHLIFSIIFGVTHKRPMQMLLDNIANNQTYCRVQKTSLKFPLTPNIKSLTTLESTIRGHRVHRFIIIDLDLWNLPKSE